MTDGNKKKGMPPVFGEIRPSQLITTFGPGSVVDLRNASVILGGTDLWAISADLEIDEPRLRSLLRVERFYRPPVRSDGGASGIPAFVFPRYLRCPRCKRLGRNDRADLFFLDKHRYRCKGKHDLKGSNRKPLVFPARFVIACSDGHLDDFPWFDYVHRGQTPKGCRPELLTFTESARSAAVSDLVVSCDLCDARRSMEDAFGKRAIKALGPCPGTRPWLGEGARQQCRDGVLRTTLRGASNLYFALVHSSLSIPDWDDPVHAAIAHHEEQLAKVSSLAALHAGIQGGFLPRLEQFDEEHVLRSLLKRREQAGKRPTASDLRHEEYLALHNPVNALRGAEREFQTEHVKVPRIFAGLIERVVVVRRLREVRAINGFTRIDSPFSLLTDDDDETEKFGVQPLSGVNLRWRPAVELRGEGVFIELTAPAVQEWQDRESVTRRSSELERIHQTWRRKRRLAETPYPGARFVLLHSLAHMVIQGLALDCGYSSSSIRERIYADSAADRPMAGILLYTATPDSDGSLGGLAEKGRPSHFGPLITDALEHARYCSSDPLCGHNAPGEVGRLNGAACHACLLVSETSCERGNQYLDRAHVVETVANLRTNFF